MMSPPKFLGPRLTGHQTKTPRLNSSESSRFGGAQPKDNGPRHQELFGPRGHGHRSPHPAHPKQWPGAPTRNLGPQNQDLQHPQEAPLGGRGANSGTNHPKPSNPGNAFPARGRGWSPHRNTRGPRSPYYGPKDPPDDQFFEERRGGPQRARYKKGPGATIGLTPPALFKGDVLPQTQTLVRDKTSFPKCGGARRGSAPAPLATPTDRVLNPGTSTPPFPPGGPVSCPPRPPGVGRATTCIKLFFFFFRILKDFENRGLVFRFFEEFWVELAPRV